jgi:membrane associated rhomboid family serine protease
VSQLPHRHNDEGPAGSLVDVCRRTGRAVVVAVARWWPLMALAVVGAVATGVAAGTGGADRFGLLGESPTLFEALGAPFVHASVAHLVGNVAVGAAFAVMLASPASEREGLGPGTLVGLFVAGAVAGELYWVLSAQGLPLVGASAGVCAWVGAAARRRVPRSARLWAAVAGVGILGALLEPRAFPVHLAGLVAGLALGGVDRPRKATGASGSRAG